MWSDTELPLDHLVRHLNLAAKQSQVRVRDFKAWIVGKRYIHIEAIETRISGGFVQQREQAQENCAVITGSTSENYWCLQRLSCLIEDKASTGSKAGKTIGVSMERDRNVEVHSGLRKTR